MTGFHIATALVTVAIGGSISISLGFLLFFIRQARQDGDAFEGTELSDRNIPAPKFDPPYLVWEKK